LALPRRTYGAKETATSTGGIRAAMQRCVVASSRAMRSASYPWGPVAPDSWYSSVTSTPSTPCVEV
jgi:hypothetical protein